MAKMMALWMIRCLKSSFLLVEMAAIVVLWGEAILVGQHHNVHHYHKQQILISVIKSPLVQAGLVGLAEVVDRWEVGGEQEMAQMIMEKAGEDKEGGLGQESVEGLEGE